MIQTQKTFPVELTQEQYDVLMDSINEKINNIKLNSLENAINQAKEYLKICKQLYPNDKVEVFVYEDTKQINVNFLEGSNYDRSMKWMNVYDRYMSNENMKKIKTSKRIYITL